MEAISTLVTVGILKGLAKLLVHAAGGDTVSESVASEIAGATVKRETKQSVTTLVDRYVGRIEQHHEFREIPEHDVNAVKLEVQQGVFLAMDFGLVASHGFDPSRVVSVVFQKRGHGGRPRDFSEQCIALYQQVMDGAVGAVLVVCESAKGWHTANARQIQSRFDDLLDAIAAEARAREKIHDTLGLMDRTIADLAAKEYRDRRHFLDVYLRAIRTTLDSVELFGLEIDPKTRAKEQRLSVAYITLNLARADEDGSSGPLSWPRILDGLGPGASGRLLVRGDAGMGKTTLLRWAAIATAAAAPELIQFHFSLIRRVLAGKSDPSELERPSESVSTPGSWRDKIPLLVVLRDCKEGRFPTPSEFPAQLSTAVGNPPERFVEWLLDQGRALVMIDGVDEVPPGPPRDVISKGIADLLAVYGDRGNLFVVTSRPLTDDPTWLVKHKFVVADISPMSDLDRDALIRRWHQAYAAQLESDEERQIVAKKADVLIEELNTRPSVARVATTPLLCAMLCAQCGVLNYTLPGGEWQIIEGLCHALLWRRDKERALPPGGTVWDALEYPQRRAIAARLANYMIKENRTVIEAEAAQLKIQDTLPWIGREKVRAAEEAAIVRERMSERGGILRITKSGSLEFVHNTFKEFLAASAFAHDLEVAFLADNALREDCANICRFAAGGESPAYAKQLLEAVLRRADRKAVRRLIAVRMTAAASALDPVVRERVKKIEVGMFPPRTAGEAKALAELGDEIIDKLRFTAAMPTKQQVMCATTLVQIGTPKARMALEAFAPTASDLGLVLQLSRALNPLRMLYVRELVGSKRPGGLPPGVAREITDARLAEWVRSDPSAGDLTILVLDDTRVTDTGVKELCHPDTMLKNLIELRLSRSDVTDAGLKELARPSTGLRKLRVLWLDHTQVSDEGVTSLAEADTGLSGLTMLSLTGSKVTDAGVKELAREDTGIKDLGALRISGTQVSDVAVQELTRPNTGLRKLTSLWLDDTQVTDASAKDLSRADTGLTALRSLYLDRTQVTDVGVRELARTGSGLSALSLLWIDGTAVTDAGVKELARSDTGLHRLRSLSLDRIQLTDSGIAALASPDSGLKELASLWVSYSYLTDVGLSDLSRSNTGLKRLKSLWLSSTSVTDAGVRELARADTGLEGLTSLGLIGTKVSDAGMRDLARADTGLKNLMALWLHGTEVTNAGKAVVRARFKGISVYG